LRQSHICLGSHVAICGKKITANAQDGNEEGNHIPGNPQDRLSGDTAGSEEADAHGWRDQPHGETDDRHDAELDRVDTERSDRRVTGMT
jgi:hypothetical protein